MLLFSAELGFMFKFNVFAFLSLNLATTKWPCSLNFDLRSISTISCPWDEMSLSLIDIQFVNKIKVLEYVQIYNLSIFNELISRRYFKKTRTRYQFACEKI